MFQVNVLLVFFKMFLLNFAITNKELYLYVLCIGILWHFNYSLGLESSVSILRTLSILLLILFKDSKCCFICTKPIRKYEKNYLHALQTCSGVLRQRSKATFLPRHLPTYGLHLFCSLIIKVSGRVIYTISQFNTFFFIPVLILF